MVEIDAGDTVWRFDRAFLTSNWTCIWDRGCHGIGATKEAGHRLGCCSLGAHLDGVDEQMLVAASADALTPELFEHYQSARDGGVFCDDGTYTRVVDGACIFLNRPGFAGGAGCALHLGAVAAGESAIDWKPSVCWQLPVHVDWEMRPDDVEVATVRAWTRADWGEHGTTMAWCCTDAPMAPRPTSVTGAVVESLADELTEIVGAEVYVELRRRLS